MKMKRLLTYILLYFCCCSLSATVKPRDGRKEPLVFADQEENDSHNHGDNGRLMSPWKIGSQSNAPLKAKGSPKVPVILVQFLDKKFTTGLGVTNGVRNKCLTEDDEIIVNEAYDKFCNGVPESDYYTGLGSHGAITEYFRDQSNGQFTPQFVVIGPVTLDDEYAFYGKDGSKGKDSNLSSFYSDAIKAAQRVYTNWSDFDNDNNNTVDMAFFIYAGEGQNGSDDENTIWPQERRTGGTINGTSYGCYACCNEIYAGETDGIGVFVHELSHAMGLPDFYDTNYVAYGMDYWDIMDSGCYCNHGYCPCNYTAYERWFMGWTELETLNPSTPQKLTLQATSDYYLNPEVEWKGYKIVNPEHSNEYYIIENRQSTGWDEYVGHGDEYSKMKGMLIVHVDYVSNRWTGNSVNTNPSHQYMTIRPADGVLDSYMYVDHKDYETYKKFMYSAYGDLYPGYKQVTAFEGPDQFVYNGSGEMDQPLLNIRQNADGTVSLDYMQIFKTDQHIDLDTIPDMTYGDSTYILPAKTDCNLELVWTVSNSDVATVNGDTLIIRGAGTALVTASQEGNAFNNAIEQTFVLNIKKAQLTITADSLSRNTGEENPELTMYFEGFVNGDDASTALTTPPDITCEADASSPAGEYAIVLSGGESTNYELTLIDGVLTVSEPPAPPHKTGDVNEDGFVDISDIVAAINHIAKTATFRYADVNEDDEVNISDIVAIINIIAQQ